MTCSNDELRRRAVRLLARREHSRAELARKLAGYGNEDEIRKVIEQLQAAHLQSDVRFAESWLRARAPRLGDARIRHDLQQRGISADLLSQTMAEARENTVVGSEIERAGLIWSRKFDRTPVSREDWARQARFLQSRGFAAETIRRVVPAIQFDAADVTSDE